MFQASSTGCVLLHMVFSIRCCIRLASPIQTYT